MSALAPFRGPVHAPPLGELNEMLEYEKILRIRDQVFTGGHPRLSVPVNVTKKVSLRSTQPPSLSQPAVPAAGSSTSRVKLPGLQLSSATEDMQPSVPMNHGPAVLPRPYLSNPPASELDPIFLTKSDHLVSAEIQLQRQRLERTLRDQLDQKRTESRNKTSLQEAKPDFDINDVLSRALEIVQPVTFEESRGPIDNASASDSFDENSFYSSKAPDSPKEGAEVQSPSSKHQVQHVDVDDLGADVPADHRSDEARQVDLTNSPYKINPRPPYDTQSQSQNNLRPNQNTLGNNGLASTAMDLDEDEEPEYSPPEPHEHFSGKDIVNGNTRSYVHEQGKGANGRSLDPLPNGRGYDSPSESDMRIVRNHITSPIPHQPSRVSPLAVAKATPTSQNRHPRQDQLPKRRVSNPASVRVSPDTFVQPIQPRKKRKLEARRAKRKTAASPEPMIKDEPVSPPPFHEAQPLGSTRPRQRDNPIYIDVDSPREVRYLPAPTRRTELSPRPTVYDMAPPVPHSDPRTYSRAGFQDPARDEQDLRKVATIQNMRTGQPRHYAEPTYQNPSRMSRASSYAIVESAARPDAIRTYQEPLPPYDRPTLREERAARSPVFNDREAQNRYYSQAMAPPPRRIVMDQDGNQFYEILQPARASVAPPITRYVDVEPVHEATSLRNGSLRAASVTEEPYREKRYVQEMPPPPPQVSYRRVTEAPRNSVTDTRSIIRAEQDPRPVHRSASVQIVDYPRPALYVDDGGTARELVRMSSVRPTATRYEEPREVIHRVQSVRPDAQEVGVFVDDRPTVRREYVQMERPTYEVRRPVREDGYYEVDDGGRMVMEGTAASRHNLAPRY